MHQFSKSVLINRPEQVVFDFMSNPANMPKWQPNVEHAEWTSAGMPGVGSTYKVAIKLLGGNTEARFEITQWDPPHRYGYKSIKVPFPVESIESDYSLTSKGNDTQLTFNAQIGIVGLLKFMEKPFGKQAEKQDGGSVDNAKQILEAG